MKAASNAVTTLGAARLPTSGGRFPADQAGPLGQVIRLCRQNGSVVEQGREVIPTYISKASRRLDGTAVSISKDNGKMWSAINAKTQRIERGAKFSIAG